MPDSSEQGHTEPISLATTPENTQNRKLKHIEACLKPESQYQNVKTGFDQLEWPYHALPNQNWADIQVGTTFLGSTLQAPILIGAMTGGAKLAKTINQNLATAAQNLGIGMMLGSQRIMIEKPETQLSFLVRDVAPDILLVGNLGAAQFNLDYGIEQALHAIHAVQADALALHINPLQEARQESGDTQWAGMLKRLTEIVPQLPFPVILKEVGHGLDTRTIHQVKRLPFAALDVAGAGGTSWARVEELVRFGEVRAPDLCELGIPTAIALEKARQIVPKTPLIASGGIRSGLDIARALAVGADAVAIARPLLEPAIESAEAVQARLQELIDELRTALFVAGFSDLASIHQYPFNALTDPSENLILDGFSPN